MKHIICIAVVALLSVVLSQNTTLAPVPTSTGPTYAIFGCSFDAASVIGSTSTSTAAGVFIGFWDGKSNLTYYIMHNVDGATGVNLHDNATSKETGPIFLSTDTFAANTLISGSWKIPRKNVANLFNNMQYIQVTSSAFPSGAIRGTITFAPYSFQYVAMLDFKSTTLPSTSVGVGLMIGSTSDKYLGVTLQHNVQGVNGAAVMGSATYCAAGNLVFNFTTLGNAINEVFDTATSQDKTSLDAGNYYVQIDSIANPQGDIRGQIQPASFYTATGAQSFLVKECRPGSSRNSASGLFSASAFLVILALFSFMM
jgi:hypothetical protein